ncbi:hypothetical protein AB0N29_03390 [Nocardioides sp. NPDC092400]|uniref:hypothetical protein n=1 Tax=Nocardioides sp. NPDC092400 TaxID=3155196 RepID=UPI0034397C53
MATTIGRGLAAGAVGTTLLNAATYLDMALTGREASAQPTRTVLRLAGSLGLEPPTDGGRPEAYGALAGTATGLGLGVAASALRRAGLRLPGPVGAVATGLAAMAATDVPMAAGGLTDPREWSAADWTRDVLPHLAYGAGVQWTLDRVTPPAGEVAPTGRVTAGLLGRSLALGAAAGSRTSLAVAGPALTSGNRARGVLSAGLVAAEVVGDKLPQAPSRLQAQATGGRLLAGAGGGAALAGRADAPRVLAVLAGAAGAAIGTVAGALWRDAAERRGWTWRAAVAEDVAAVGLTALAVRRS